MIMQLPSIFLSLCLGLSAVAISKIFKNPIFDPLVIALTLGIISRFFLKSKKELIPSVKIISSYFIPIGVIFYGATNLNFVNMQTVDTNYIFMLFIVFLVYVISGFILAALFGLNEQISCLIVAGSTICGASAIIITSEVIDAQPDDVSNSLMPVFLSALIGLFVIIPFFSKYLGLSSIEYGIFSGTVLQFTGFVKASVVDMSSNVKSIALSVKAVRYLGLLFLLPLFGSFIKGRLYIPWFLWAFLGAGIIFSSFPLLYQTSAPTLKILLSIFWSISMAAIGLNADIKKLFTKIGLKAFVVSLMSFMIAVIAFLLGIKFVTGV